MKDKKLLISFVVSLIVCLIWILLHNKIPNEPGVLRLCLSLGAAVLAGFLAGSVARESPGLTVCATAIGAILLVHGIIVCIQGRLSTYPLLLLLYYLFLFASLGIGIFFRRFISVLSAKVVISALTFVLTICVGYELIFKDAYTLIVHVTPRERTTNHARNAPFFLFTPGERVAGLKALALREAKAGNLERVQEVLTRALRAAEEEEGNHPGSDFTQDVIRAQFEAGFEEAAIKNLQNRSYSSEEKAVIISSWYANQGKFSMALEGAEKLANPFRKAIALENLSEEGKRSVRLPQMERALGTLVEIAKNASSFNQDALDIRVDPEFLERTLTAHVARSQAHLGDYAGARRTITESSSRPSRKLQNLTSVGEIALKDGQVETGRSFFKAAIDLLRAHPEIRLNGGMSDFYATWKSAGFSEQDFKAPGN